MRTSTSTPFAGCCGTSDSPSECGEAITYSRRPVFLRESTFSVTAGMRSPIRYTKCVESF